MSSQSERHRQTGSVARLLWVELGSTKSGRRALIGWLYQEASEQTARWAELRSTAASADWLVGVVQELVLDVFTV